VNAYKLFNISTNNETVYYMPPACCDERGGLYNDNGEFIGAPDGSFTGNGDGACPDFFEKSQVRK